MTVYGIGRNDHRPGFREWVSQQRVVLFLLGAVSNDQNLWMALGEVT
jgi:hypothetical protein